MIAILVPVLARPKNAHPLVSSIRVNSAFEHRILFLCSPGDREEILTCKETGADVHIVDWEAGPGDWARKINRGFAMTSEAFVLLGADDLRFHSGWDEVALEVAEKSGAGVIGTNDLTNPTVMKGKHSTHPLVRREYVEQFGTIDESEKVLCEQYHHQWCDTELVETAIYRGQWAFARDSHVEHFHPIFGKAEMDATYEKALSTSREDRDLFIRRRSLWRGGRRQLRVHVR